MNFISKKFLLTAFLAVVTPFALFAKVDYIIEEQPIVLEKAVSLEAYGILKQKDNGYLYIDVDNAFIGAILPLIECEGRIVPPQHYKSKKGIGAHISVMYENERIENEIWSIHELSQTYPFQIKELRTVKISRDGKMKKLWLLAVEAPALEQLRNSYGLTNLLKGHDFHITIGYQLPTSSQPSGAIFIIEEELDEEVFAAAA